MSVVQIQQPPGVQVQRETSEAEDSNSEFLSIKLVNPRARVKLSEPLDLSSFPSAGHLFAVASTARHFAAITAGSILTVSPLSNLRQSLYAADDATSGTFTPARTLSLAQYGTPHYVLFAHGDTRLLVGFVQGPVQVYDTSILFTPGGGDVQPIHTFPSTTTTAVRQMHANPNAEPGLSELVAILREPDGSGDSLLVEVVNVASMSSVCGWRGGGTSETFPTSLSWSPKGKQLAIGLQSGSILTFSPSSPTQPKSFVPSPPPSSFPAPFNSSPSLSLLYTHWLSAPEFYGIYAPPGQSTDPNVEQAHLVVTYDGKQGKARDVGLPINFFTSGLRPPGAFVVVLRGWEPMKVLMVVGDSTSADIALVSLVSENGTESWKRLSLEDAATPSMPLDTSSNETVLLGLELDLHNDQPYTHVKASGEGVDVPSPPIVLAYASDGTVLGWVVVNTEGRMYPGMAAAGTGMQAEPAQQPASGGGGFGAFAGNGASAFGQPSSFGGQSATAQPTSAFGQTGFGQTGFGQTAQSQQSSSPFGGSSGGGGFAAFAQKPAAFGQSGFGSSNSSSTPTPSSFASPPSTFNAAASPPTSSAFNTSTFGAVSSGFTQPREPAPAMEESNSISMTDEDSMGGMGLGGAGSTEGKVSSAFGAFGSGSGGGGGSGFGGGGGGGSAFAVAAQRGSVFGQTSQPTSAFGQTSGSSSALGGGSAQPSSTVSNSSAPAFGQSGFGAQASGKPAFGQSGFATKSAFGQSSFGGGSPMSTTPISATAPTGGAFSSFASGGASAFGKAPAPASTTPAAAPSSGGFGAFATAKPSAFGQAASGGGGAPAWRTEKKDDGEGMKPAPVFGGASSSPSSGSVFSTPASAFGSTTPTAAPPASATEPRTPAPLAAPAFGSPSSPTPNSPLSPPDTPVHACRGSPPYSPVNPSTTTPAGPPPAATKPAPVDPSTTTPTAPPPLTSAFSHLARPSSYTSSNNAFGVALNKDSPFAKAASGSNAPLTNNAFSSASGSAFALPTSASAPSGAGGGGSVFGKSAFSGLGKDSPFAAKPKTGPESTTPKEAPPSSSSAASNAFSAFGGGVSAFGKVGGAGGKSFSEMLKGDGAEKKEGEKKVVSAFPPVRSAFAVSVKGKEEEGRGVKKEDSAGSLADSYVDVGEESGDEEPEGSAEGSERGRDEIDDFLSDEGEGEEEEEEYDEEEEEEEEEEEGLEDIPEEDEEPTTTMPAVKLDPPTPDRKGKGKSTTPPGSPSRSPSPTPKLAQPTPTLPGSSIGLGRPNSRPTRSSPLASSAVSGAEDEKPKPRPASPKTPFGMLPPLSAPKSKISPSVLSAELPVEDQKKPSPVAGRPKTPPMTALFGFGGTKSSSAASVPSVSANVKQEAPSPVLAPSPSTPSLFSGFKPGGLFGAPSKSTSPAPVQPSAEQGKYKLFNPPPPLSGSQGSLFGAPPTPSSAPATPAPPAEKLEPLQAEFLNLFVGLNKELEDLGVLAQDAERKTKEMTNPPPPPPGRSAITIGIVQDVRQATRELADDMRYLQTSFKEDEGFVRELETGVLRAKTRKEVVAKFDAAKEDAGYSKIMKSQSLNPDHSEQQTQLRRSIRTISERVAQLEGKLQTDKRRLEEARTGKSRIKPPSLDTVNRTFRNIDLAIEQQSADVAALSARISKLDLTRPPRARTRHDRATPEPTPRPRAVTPSVAERTAAALSAERAAFKLKAALLNARSEPLLNTKASSAPPALHAFADPSRPAPISAPSSGFFSTPFTLPPLSSGDVTVPGPTAGRKRVASATHQKSVQMKPAVSATPTPASGGGGGGGVAKPTFDWGPLPGVKPTTSLAADLRTPPPKLGR